MGFTAGGKHPIRFDFRIKLSQQALAPDKAKGLRCQIKPMYLKLGFFLHPRKQAAQLVEMPQSAIGNKPYATNAHS